MPDVQEVYEMITKHKPPEPGALERQQKRQVRAARNKKLGAFAVAAVIGVVAIGLILVMRPGPDTAVPAVSPTVNPTDAEAVQVATGFVESFGALDSEQAITYLADDAIIETFDARTLKEFRLSISFLEAIGYKQMLDPCEVTSSLEAVTNVRCTFDLHLFRSDEIGKGPFSGSYFDLTVRDGEIAWASQSVEIEEFSSQMWEPFRDWVSTDHPEDVTVLYVDETQTMERITERSIRLWELRTREYVREVDRGTAGG